MKNQRVGIIGSGTVAQILGAGFLKHGHDVMLGTRDTTKLSDWLAGQGKGAQAGSFQETATFADIVVLAVKGTAAKQALEISGEAAMKGKVVIDATNPISDEQPEEGVLKFFTSQNKSLMEELQLSFPNSKFVKAFSSVGSALMVNPQLAIQPTMFIAGNDNKAKQVVTDILTQFGWEVEDMGAAQAARAIEPLCMLWCIPGFRNNQWMHAFKLIK